jgi:alpha-tubulin suppressor-like RCC1 family protein
MPNTYVNGSLWLWGANDYGQLGDGTNLYKSSPIQIVGTLGWSYVDANGNHTVGIQMDGRAWAWGNNSYGQLGDNTILNKNIPTLITGAVTLPPDRWDLVKSGYNFSLGTKVNGTLWSWGINSSGQLGDGTFNHRSSPVVISVTSGNRWASISAGKTHAAALLDGKIFIWGTNAYGELGQNDDDPYNVPMVVNPQTFFKWTDVYCGDRYTLALRNDGSVWAWGRNTDGEFGNEDYADTSSPVQVLFPVGYWTTATAARGFSGAINTRGYSRATTTPSPSPSPSPTPTPTVTPTPTATTSDRTPSPTPSHSTTPTPTPTPSGTTAATGLYVIWAKWV